MPLINCEVSLTLTITTQTGRAAQGDNPARPAINALRNATFKVANTNCMFQLLLGQPKMIIIF